MKTFLDELKSVNNLLYQYVNNSIREIEPILNDINNSIFKEYTDHTKNHSIKVLDLATRLNGSNKLTMYELAVFILSSFYHDIGMFVKVNEMNEYINTIERHGNYEALSEDIKTIEKLRTQDEKTKKYFLALDHFRSEHAQRSYDFISKKYPESSKESFFNGIYIWDAVRRICYSHTLDIKKLDNSEYPTKYPIGDGETIDLLYLSLLLRLSDICHFSRDRAFPYFFRLKNFISEKSESIWQYYGDVVDTYPNNETNIIEVNAICKNFYNHRAIIEDSKNIQKELENCHLTLAKYKSIYQLPWKIVTVFNMEYTLGSNYEYYNTKFRLDYPKIVNLLMGDRLYHDSLFSIRECIQNSLDSINVYCKKTTSTEGYILIDYKSDSVNGYILDIYDTGTGMDKEIINEYFLSIGSKSFWYSNRCFDEWGITKINTRVIADHGIGVLSYFMIANGIEVFSIYQKSGESIHVDIENYLDGIIFKKTPLSKFPVFECSEITSTPWDMNHGTCIRFHLKEKLQENVLLKFLAKHILRSKRRIILNFPSYQKELDNIWHYRNSLDTHCYSKESSKYYYDYSDQLDSEKGEQLDVESLYKKL